MMSNEQNLLMTNAALLERMLTQLESIQKLLSITYTYPRGMTLTSTIHLTLNSKPTRIDFVNASRHRNIPTGDAIRTANVPVSRIILYNLGPGGIHFDTNRDYNSIETETPVSSSSNWEIMCDYPSITSVTMVAQNDNAKVRLTAII